MTTTTHRAETVEDIRSWTAYRLASEADCGSPDNTDSEGAGMLVRVRDAALELVEDLDIDAFENLNDDGSVSELADGAPSIYTYTKWQQFVDLSAYQEDLDDLGGTTGDMDRDASVALYIIAERLAYAVIEAVKEAAQEDIDSTDEDED